MIRKRRNHSPECKAKVALAATKDDKTGPLPVKRQCKLLNIARSTADYRPARLSDETLELRRLIDGIHLNFPFMGSRHIRNELAKQDKLVSRKRIVHLMKQMGIAALYPKPKTTLLNNCS